MASSSPIKLIEKALLATGPFALSYTDPDQKWLIRKHLTSFLQEFPNFELSTDTFNHNNGTTVQLFRLQGSLRTTAQLPSVQLTIWVHESYPITPPLVFVNPNYPIPIRTNHPFVTSSGLTNSNYIENWEHPRCSLLDSIRNLRRVLANDHPFVGTDSNSIPNRIQSVSRTEAIDRLATSLHYDALAIMERSEEEIENLWKLQSEVRNRSESVRRIICELETEREKLKERVAKLKDDTDVLEIWVERNHPRLVKATSGVVGIEEMFEKEGDEDEDEDEEAKKLALESLAADEAIEEVLGTLEEAAEKGVLEMGSYLKQVRVLAREQFFCRYLINHCFL
uniref:Protein ELC-like n=1 Tax=Noccaea caerulescens TaxID=107243 RepID=A0A1J3JAC9_NOCCA